MDRPNVYKIFNEELSSITDETVRGFAAAVLESLPGYFWEKPSSSTGKYHSPVTNGRGGLVIHVKMAVKAVNELAGLEMWELGETEKDLVRCAVLLHDGLKYGDGSSQYTVFEHPILMASYVMQDRWEEYLPKTVRKEIAEMIVSHHGQWNTSKKSQTVLPKPVTKAQMLVHLADYIGSRRDIVLKVSDIADGYERLMQITPASCSIQGSQPIQSQGHQQAVQPSQASYTGQHHAEASHSRRNLPPLKPYTPKEAEFSQTDGKVLSEKTAKIRVWLEGHRWDRKIYTDGQNKYIFRDGRIYKVPDSAVIPLTIIGIDKIPPVV